MLAGKIIVRPKDKELVGCGSLLWLLIYCAGTFGFFWYSVAKLKHVLPISMSAFFAASGLIALVATIRLMLIRSKFGDVALTLDGRPTVGGQLRALVRAPKGATKLQARITFSSIELNEKNRPSERLVWGRDRSFRARGGDVTEMTFDLPEHLPPSSAAAAWALKVSAEVPGVDFSFNYDIDVWAAPEGQPKRAPLPAQAAAPLPAPGALPGRPALAAGPAHVARTTGPVAADRSPEPAAPAGTPWGSVGALVAANALALVGVAFWGWAVRDIVLLYWMETVIIGGFNVLRIAFADLGALARKRTGVVPTAGEKFMAKFMLAGFFSVHYGGFCYFYGTALLSLFPGKIVGEYLGRAVRDVLLEPGMFLPLLAMIASHAYSFFYNYLGGGEGLRADGFSLMVRPYQRIFVTQAFLVAAGLFLTGRNAQVPALVAFIAIKIGFDVYYHRWERQARGA